MSRRATSKKTKPESTPLLRAVLPNRSQINVGTEPTAEDLAAEEAFLDAQITGSQPEAKTTATKNQRKGKKKDSGLEKKGALQNYLSDQAKDVLASYMDQLSHIPLFTPEEELENARELERIEMRIWDLIVRLPRGVEIVLDLGTELDPPVIKKLQDLLTSYRRAAAKTDKLPLPPQPKRDRLIKRMCTKLRVFDSDKELHERVMQVIRQDVWTRRPVNKRKIFRIHSKHLLPLEQVRGEGLRARNNFVRANLRLVVSVAKKFQNKRIPFIDLVQEGNMGLMKAVHRFDHRRGYRFSTYAHWWIRQSIERAIINKGSQVRLPVHVIDSRRQIGRATTKLKQDLGRIPSTDEIAKSVNLSTTKVESLINGVQQDPVSLDESVGEDDPRKFLDLVRDPNNPAIDEAIIRENTLERIRDLMTLLNPMERDIITRRFGLGDDSDQTLDEIGKRYNLSRERVRQIQVQGLAKMRRMCDRRHINL